MTYNLNEEESRKKASNNDENTGASGKQDIELSLDRESLVKAIILSEVLEKPKAKRKRR